MTILEFEDSEIKILYQSVLYYQRYKTKPDGPEYKTCHKLLNHLKSEGHLYDA